MIRDVLLTARVWWSSDRLTDALISVRFGVCMFALTFLVLAPAAGGWRL